MSSTITLTNARIVTGERDFNGNLHVRCGKIAGIDEGVLRLAGAEDWDGDFLLPGFIELHTDNLEKHLMPRPKVSWPEFPALLAHDAEIAAAGITTVYDALGVGDVDEAALRGKDMSGLLDCFDQAEKASLLRVEHRLHVRCELPAPNAVRLFEPFLHNPRVQLLSLMDHTPGQRQWTNVEQARIYYTGKKGWSDKKFNHVVAESKTLQQQYAGPHRRFFTEHARSRNIPLASHDDTTPQHVAEAREAGIAVSEFPTTGEAARAARRHGLGIVMGAPNVVRGGSHSGNISATDLAAEGLLDVLSSDYVPSSLLSAAFMLVDRCGFSLAQAVATISLNPARRVGLNDRGEIAVDKRADFSRVRVLHGTPSVIAVWRGAKRIA
jgi:alpha-D-ribose 1-methylphosphonate 5-triphosphate diphosphatase